MAKLFTLYLLFVVTMSQVQAQSTNRTKDNYTGNWDDQSTWRGNSDLDQGTIEIYGKVTRTGNLPIANSMMVYDTLWITGDLDMNPGSSLLVKPDGIVIVTGDMNNSSFWLLRSFDVDVLNQGRIVVMGNVNIKEILRLGEANVTNSNAFYIFGSLNTSGGATFTGTYGNEQDLIADNSLYDLINGGTLPVTFLYVRAGSRQDGALINWATASEKKNDYFIVQRSVDGKTYEDIGRVDGAGNSFQVRSYSFVDEHPIHGKTYYRIKQTDFDGQTDFSDVVLFTGSSAVTRAQPDIQIYPNPSAGEIHLNYIGLEEENLTLTIYNSTGTVVFTREEGQAHPLETRLDLSTMRHGIYLLEVKSAHGTIRKRIMIK